MKVEITIIAENNEHPTEEEVSTEKIESTNRNAWQLFLDMFPSDDKGTVTNCRLIER